MEWIAALATLMTAIATLMTAIFTGLLWRVSKQQAHILSNPKSKKLSPGASWKGWYSWSLNPQ